MPAAATAAMPGNRDQKLSPYLAGGNSIFLSPYRPFHSLALTRAIVVSEPGALVIPAGPDLVVAERLRNTPALHRVMS